MVSRTYHQSSLYPLSVFICSSQPWSSTMKLVGTGQCGMGLLGSLELRTWFCQIGLIFPSWFALVLWSLCVDVWGTWGTWGTWTLYVWQCSWMFGTSWCLPMDSPWQTWADPGKACGCLNVCWGKYGCKCELIWSSVLQMDACVALSATDSLSVTAFGLIWQTSKCSWPSLNGSWSHHQRHEEETYQHFSHTQPTHTIMYIYWCTHTHTHTVSESIRSTPPPLYEPSMTPVPMRFAFAMWFSFYSCFHALSQSPSLAISRVAHASTPALLRRPSPACFTAQLGSILTRNAITRILLHSWACGTTYCMRLNQS